MLKIKIKKELGQNFIIKKGIIKNIIKIINIKKYENIVELGSGIGLITQKVLDITKNKIYSIEIDKELIIGKQRNGPIGVINIKFIGKYTKFEN